MERRAVERAEEQLQLASDYYAKVRETEKQASAKNFTRAWNDFLTHANRVFTKLEHGAKMGSSKGWFDLIKDHRKTDPILSYMWHARNASEHGNSVLGYDNVAEPPSMTALFGKEAITPSGFRGPPAIIRWLPRLLPVMDRGELYHPPKSHIPVPSVIGEKMMSYLRDLVAEARTRIVG